jgi:alginate O-acetyltransferase complex protein AlgI
VGSASFDFLAFALGIVLIYNLLRPTWWRQAVLFAANMIFLATFSTDYRQFIPFAGFIVFGYAGLKLVERASGRRFFAVVAAVIAMFVWLKQYSFVPGALYLKFSYLTVGLSYILFRVLHVIIDRHSEPFDEQITFFRYLLYTTSFTTLVSGPIQRYSDFARMAFARVRPALTLRDGAAAVERIVVGYFKTNVAALLFSVLHSRALASVTRTGSSKVLPGAIMFVSYTLFLYCNFAGYIDIVIGISRLLRITLPENFRRPFSADNFIEFWNRWHITLSQWLKTYVYTPLLMTLMRRYPAPRLELAWTLLAFFLTFVLVGVWHGQTPAFLFFGFLQGLGVSGNKLYQVLMVKRLGRQGYRDLAANASYVAVSRGLTFTWFTFTLIWFWSKWDQIGRIYSAIGAPQFIALWGLVLVASTVVLTAWEAAREGLLSISTKSSSSTLSRYWTMSRYWRTARLTLLVFITLSVVLFLGMAPPDIVYKAF